MPIVKMPDGTQVQFPDTMPADQIRDMIASKFPEVVPKPGLIDRAKTAIEGAVTPASAMDTANVSELMHNREPITPESPIQQDLSTTGQRALTETLSKQLPNAGTIGTPMTDAEAAQASMAKTSDFLKGNTSPLLTNVAAATISPEQSLAAGTEALGISREQARLKAQREADERFNQQYMQQFSDIQNGTLEGDIQDIRRSVAMGSSGLAQMATNLAYAVTGSSTAKDVADQFGKWSGQLESGLTPNMKAAVQKNFVPEAGKPAEAWSDPRSYLFQVYNQAGSAIPMIGVGRLIGLGAEGVTGLSKLKPAMDAANTAGETALRDALASGAERAAAVQVSKDAAQAAFSTEAAKVGVQNASLAATSTKMFAANLAGQTIAGTYLHGSDAANAAMEQIAQMPHSKLMLSPEYSAAYKANLAKGESDDQAQYDAKETVRRSAGITAAEVTGSAALPSQLLMSFVNARLFTGGMGSGSRAANFGKALAMEAPANAFELGMVAYGGNVGVQKHADQTLDTSAGVLDTAVKAAIGAGGMAVPHLLVTPHERLPGEATEQPVTMADAHEKAADVLVQPTVDDAIRAASDSVEKKTNDELLDKLNILAGVVPSTAPATVGTAATSPVVEQQGPPIANAGHPTEIVLPDNKSLPAQWQVIDADQVKAAMQQGQNQPRDRTRAASNVQVQGIANNPNYTLLRDSPVMDFGAPTLTQDGAIVGGNGRFEGVSRAYDQGSAADYRAKLEADAASKGIDPATFSGMAKPVLVRRITRSFDTKALAVASNAGGSLQYSALEQARIDGDRMKDLGNIEVNDTGDVVMSGDNMTNVRRALAGYTPAEFGSLVDKDGQLSQEGIRRIKNALLYKAYGDSTALSRMVESADPELKSVMGALTRAAGSVASVRADMEAGHKPVEADITPHLLSAVEQLAKIKAQGVSVEQHLAQKGLLGKEHTDESAEILQFLQANIRSQKRMAEFIKTYYDGIAHEDHLTGSMFETAPITNKERVSHAIETTKQANPEEAPGPTGKPGEAVEQQSGGTEGNAPRGEGGQQDAAAVAKAKDDFEKAKAEAGAFLRSLGAVTHIVPEEHERLLPILVKLFDAAFRLGYYDVKAATRYVRAELSKMGEDIAKRVKFIPVSLMERAAKEASKNAQNLEEQGLFAKQKEKPVVLDQDMPLFHGTRQGNKFSAFEIAENKNLGVGSNVFNQGHYAYLTQSREAAQWFADKATENATLRSGKLPGENEAGNVLEFTLKKGAKILHVENMPQGEKAAALIKQAEADGVDAISFRDPAFDKVEGSKRIHDMLNSGKPMDTVLVLGHDKLASPEPVLKSYTNAEILAREAAAKKAEKEANKPEVSAPITADQADLFDTQGTLFTSNREVPVAERAAVPDTWKLADNKKEYIDENGFIRGLEMSERERAVEQEFYDAILSDIHGQIEKYQKVVLKPEEGKLVDPDRIKELSDAFKADNSLAHAVHEPSSYLSKRIFETWVAEDIEKPAVFTAGGGGSGKTEAMSTAQKVAGINPEGVVFDSTLSSFASASKKINQVLDAGGKATVVYTNTPIEKAFNFAAGRKRVVPIDVLARAHQGASDTIRMLDEYYKDNPNVEIIVINNAGELHEIRQGNVDNVPHYDYNEVLKKLYQSSKEKLDSGSITQERFDALTNGLPEGVKNEKPQQSRVQQNGEGSLGGLQEGKSERESQGLRGRPAGHQENAGLQGEGRGTLGAENEYQPSGAISTQGQGAAANGGTAVERDAGGIHTGQGQRDLFSNDFPSTTDSREPRIEPSGRAEAGADHGRGNAVSAGNRPGRATGIPAGNDIPAKSGLNYHFTDSDLDYKGSWLVKARQNMDAVELIKKLESENRQATREEQAVLAKFIGWGASDIRNKIFDPQIDRVRRKVDAYNEAMDWLNNNNKEAMSRFDYGSPYYTVMSMLNAAGQSVPYGQSIDKSMVEKLADKEASKWLEMHDKLKEMLTPEEWATAERSTQYAHYTGKEVVNEIWRAVDRLGFKGGAILEPGAGIGIFPGLMDHAMANNSVYTGIEYDALTGAILKQLLPDERILVESYVDTHLPNDFYDVAIGNPPFSGTKILSDPAYKKYAFALHDYFFAKTMDKVKPGGLVTFVTSRYTMDKQGDKARQYLAERADLLGAIRLPETAFKKNAGTEVVTDILFLRKKVPGESFQGEPWMNLQPISVKGGKHQINEYFAAHPEMVLGEGAIDKNGMYAKDQYTVLPNKEVPITDLLAKAVDSLPSGVFNASPNTSAQAAQIREIDWNPKAKKEGNYYVADDGKLMQVENKAGIPATVSKKDEPLIKDYVALRDAINQAQYDQLNDGPWEESLKALNKQYDAFVEKHGNLLKNTVVVRTRKTEDEEGNKIEEKYETRRFDTISKLNDDPEFTKLYALESLNDDTGVITKGAFLKGRVLDKPKESRIDTPQDAMLSVLNDTGRVDIPLIAKRIGLDERDVIEALGSTVFKQPNGTWTTSDDYLSGNVKKKLADAEAAAKTDRSFERNVKALIEAQPSPVPPSDITASLGMNWIPAKVYEQFLRDVSGSRVTVAHNEVLGTWKVSLHGGEDTTKFGTLNRDASSILEHALTGRPIRVNTRQADAKEATFDAGATELANQKLREMREAFKGWLWNDAGRTDELVKLYNDKFNTTVARSFDGSHLTLPGTTSTITVFNHVKRGAWRVIQSGNTYLAHAVGSGKTWEMVISAMEQKRLGMINKPMMVVPNHMLQQFAQEWLQLYPAARLMVADETQFHKDNRQRFVSRAAMSDLDGVIITHSAFKLLDVDPEFKQKMLNEEIAQMEAARDNAMAEEGEEDVKKSRNPKVRQIQAAIEQLEERVKASMQGAGKDTNVRFDEMGVDMLYVDEAHLYRKLNFSTARQVKGISSGGSEYARDLHIKTRWLEERHPGRSLVLASGTPITNTLAEIYSVQRFMKPQVLEEKGLHDFDAWASMFGEESTEIEADAAGKYANVTRFSKFVNVPELTQMFREFADVLTSDHLAEILGEFRPKVKYGSRKLVITSEVPDYLAYKEELAQRLQKSRMWKPSKDQPNNPDPIIRIIGDGRLAAIDMRFIDNTLPSDPNSKLNQLADGVIKVYKENGENQYFDKAGKLELHKGAAQMVFSDLGFGKGVTESRGFDARAWFERRLTMAGIPKNQIAFMSDYKKSEEKIKLFKEVNAGKIRVLVGSSKNMGTGVNAQQRLIALHHLDTPWFPVDLEQREGRIIRQGNKNKVVQIYAYSTKGSYDTVMWQLLARKQGFIDQALSGDSAVRTLDDISEVSQFQMATAMTAGDERAIRLAGLKADIDKYDRLYRGHEQQRMKIKEQYNSAKFNIGFYERQLPDAEKLAAKVQDLSGDKFTAVAGSKKFDSRKEWAQALLGKLKHYADVGKEGTEKIGEISGFPVEIVGHINRNENGKVLSYDARIELAVGDTKYIMARDANESDIGMSLRMTNQLADIQRMPEKLRKNLADDKSKLNALESRLDTPFQFTKELTSKIKEAADLEAEMTAAPQEPVAAPEPIPPGEAPLLSRAPVTDKEKQVSALESKLDLSQQEAEEMFNLDYRIEPETGELYRDASGAGPRDLFSQGAGIANPHTVKSFHDALISAHKDRDMFALQSMLDSGKAKIVTEEEAQALRGKEWLGSRARAFYNPNDDTTYFIADNNSKTATPEELRGLVRHEIAIHAMHLGRTSAEFQSILKQLEMMHKAGNKKVVEAWNSVPEGTKAENVPEEALGYLTQNNSELPIIKRVIAWFRNAIRAIGKTMPTMQRLKMFEWANRLSDDDLLYMAQTAMRTAYHPETEKQYGYSPENVQPREPKTEYEKALREAGLFSRTEALPIEEAQQAAKTEAPEETRLQAAQRTLQDKMNRFAVIRDWLAGQGKTLSEAADVWMAEGNMHGKIASRSEDFRTKVVEPLIKRTQESGFTMPQVAEYLEMKHIPEANARMRQIHGNANATANGVTDAGANAVLAQYRAMPNFAKLDAAAKEWQAITTSTREILVNSGIITPEMAKAWQDTYQNYVPLKGDEEQTGAGTGKGLGVNGKTKRRLGHGDREEAVIQNLLRDHERAIQISEKNKVGIALIRMAVEASDPDLITVGRPEKRQVFKDKTAFEVQYKGVPVGSFDTQREAQDFILRDAALAKRQQSSYGIQKSSDPSVVLMATPMLQDNEVNVYLNGHAVRVQLNDELLAQAYTNMGVEHVGALLAGARSFNSWLSKAYTGYNPEFALVNLSRDLFAGSINLTGDYGAGMTAKIYANYPRAMAELIKSFRDPAKSKLVSEYRAAGGSTGAAYLSDLERIGKDVMSSYNEYAGSLDTLGRTYGEAREKGHGKFVAGAKATGYAIAAGYKHIPFIGHFLTLMEHLNAVTENALRVATFATLKENGYSDAKAAQAAKMSTVNFNRKGEISNAAGALYLFFNPSVQGIQRATSVLASSKHKYQARALAGMMTLGAFLIAEMMRGGSDDDKKKWAQTPDYVKDRNIVINLGDDNQATLPLPYEYSLFWSLGNILSDAVHGRDGWKLGVRLSDAVFANFSPIGNPIQGMEATPLQTLPTALKMIASPSLGQEGQDAFGRPLLPKRFSEAKPESQTMFRATKGTPYAGTAETLNSLTGGDAYHKGKIDVSPETMKYWVESLTGGTGKFAMDSITLGANIARGVDEVELREMPVVRKFVRESGVSDARQLFYTHVKEAKDAADALLFAKQARDPSGAMKIVNEDLVEIKLAAYAQAYQKQLKAYSDLVDTIRLDDKLTLNEKRLQMKMMEKKEQAVYDAFDKHFTQLMATKQKP